MFLKYCKLLYTVHQRFGMETIWFYLLTIWLMCCIPSTVSQVPEILTSQSDFKIIKNETTEINFLLKNVADNDEIAVSKKHGCSDVEEFIYIGGRLTPNAREGIAVNVDKQNEYSIKFNNAIDDDVGTYVISVLKQDRDRYELVTNRSIDLLGEEEDDLKIRCNSMQTCDTTGWRVGFAVALTLFVISVAVGIFLFIRLMQIIGEEEEKQEKHQQEDIYVLRHVGASVRSQTQNNDAPQDLYESMDDEEKRKTFSNSTMRMDEDKYMIPDRADGDNISQFSQPEVDALQSAEADASEDVGSRPSSDYDFPAKIDPESKEQTTSDDVPADVAPTLPSYNRRSQRESMAPIVDTENTSVSETYERISYGKYARRFRRIGKCNIL